MLGLINGTTIDNKHQRKGAPISFPKLGAPKLMLNILAHASKKTYGLF
jgi:hypothetical protein